MSHVNNMQSFEKLMGFCTGLGGNYNPGKQNLQVNAMTTLSTIAQQIGEEVREARKAYDDATNAREQGFSDTRTLSSSVYFMLKCCGANSLLLADALNNKRRIWGAPITKPKAMDPEKAKEEKSDARPSYGRSYIIIAEYFDRLVKIVASEPGYQANEPRLTLEGLKQKAAELFALNKAVADTEVQYDEVRAKRNIVYYIDPQGLVETADAVKAYVRSVFGFGSQQHLQVQKLRFTKPIL